MSELGSSPPKTLYGRIPPLAFGFLPLSSDDVITTRGQALTALIQSHSTTSLYNMEVAARRAASTLSDGDEESYQERPHLRRVSSAWGGGDREDLRYAIGAQTLMNPKMRSMRLIGNSNPRYRWEQYWKTDEELSQMKKPLREYYQRNNFLISQYAYIDRLLDSSLPHDLLSDYYDRERQVQIPKTITEEPPTPSDSIGSSPPQTGEGAGNGAVQKKPKRTPKTIYRLQNVDENTPLMTSEDGEEEEPQPKSREIPGFGEMGDEDVDSGAAIVTTAIYINIIANTILLISKIAVIVMTSSLSVLASLIDAILDFLSTAIVWTTTRLISRSQKDQYSYPIGRRRLEPIGVLIFSVIMITSFFQVMLQCFNRLTSGDREIVQLTIPAIIIMAGTVIIKGAAWFWCRLIKNSSVQALAEDAKTDVVFNTFSIIFPLIGFYAQIWWLDAFGGLVLSLYVIINWSRTSSQHIRNLTGAAATADERNVLLYLAMRFAKTIQKIQGIQAYHAGDKLNVEIDLVLDENMSLRDSHDLGEALQYVLESLPNVDRAFVHQDYASYNLPSHLSQFEE